MRAAAHMAVAAAKSGGEDQSIKARSRFRIVTQGALDEFQRLNLGKDSVDPRETLVAEARLGATCREAAFELHETVAALQRYHSAAVCGND